MKPGSLQNIESKCKQIQGQASNF